MKGLILKDLFTLRQQAKIYSFMMLLFAAIGILSDSPAYFGSITCMIVIMLPVTALSYDERAHWDKYALSLPVSRKDMVRSKYVLGGLITLIGFLLVLLFSLIRSGDLPESMTLSVALWLVSIFLFSVLMPIFIKFGVEKGRIIMMAVFFMPVIVLLVANSLHAPLPDMDRLSGLKYFLPVILFAVAGGSYFLSVKLYERKNF